MREDENLKRIVSKTMSRGKEVGKSGSKGRI
jgi:hypothetical protein